jgi:2-polyprenyl-3-methyl-5-hydroxy-6-metoxy-1,4-benzoquinol methylase
LQNFLFDHIMSNKLQLIPCPLCQNQDNFLSINNTNIDLHIHKYENLYENMSKSEWKVCSKCGFVHQNPRPSIQQLNEFYLKSEYHQIQIPDWYLESNGKYYLDFARWYYIEKIAYAIKKSGLPTGKVFDIGSGYGGVLKIFAEDFNWEISGVEPDTNLFNYSKNILKLDYVQNNILDDKIQLNSQVDLVFSNHAFEHFADLDQVMLGINKILKPGGYIFTAIPTFYKNRSDLSLQWMNSAHYSMFTHNSLNQLFSKYGFEEVAHTYRGYNKEIDDLWHLAKFTGVVKNHNIFFENPAQVQLYTNVINPINSAINYPLYFNYAVKVQTGKALYQKLDRIQENFKLLLNSPQIFWHKFKTKLGFINIKK